MKPIDGPQLAAQARAQYDLELSDARTLALAGMVRGYLDFARDATRALPMDAEPATFLLTLDAYRARSRS
ncbi:MAG: hypothetical protein EXQ99_06365 [Alphaproteobacteria bacterium]|nr:hypothetical protein [Alphaproteobacteria bacterium]